jgi:hypothetical protein
MDPGRGAGEQVPNTTKEHHVLDAGPAVPARARACRGG